MKPLKPKNDACSLFADCAPREFCKIAQCDSHEGWTYACSYCRPCRECLCNTDSSTGLCPANQLSGQLYASDRCPGSPYADVRTLEGTFLASSARASWGGDVCHTTLTVRSSFFRMVSFLVDKSLYTVSPAAVPNVMEGNQSLCDFPDAPGMMEGRITNLPRTQPDTVARLLLTYVSDGALGITRIVSLYGNCPSGLTADFEPILWIPMPYNSRVKLAPPRYAYVSGIKDRPLAVTPQSGYAYIGDLADGVVRVNLEGPTTGYRGLSGKYSGYFVFGTTRIR